MSSYPLNQQIGSYSTHIRIEGPRSVFSKPRFPIFLRSSENVSEYVSGESVSGNLNLHDALTKDIVTPFDKLRSGNVARGS
jgi:hypothetical protein